MRQELASLCHEVAKRGVLWTQGPGGNVSIKHAGELLVKASGLRLDAVTVTSGCAKLDLARLLGAFDAVDGVDPEASYLRAIAVSAATGTRASMETGLHAVLSRKYVFHFHSLVCVLVADLYRRDRARVALALKQLAEGFSVKVLPFVLPGYQLMEQARQNARYDVLILENHGVIFQTDDSATLERWFQIERRLAQAFDWNLSPEPEQLERSIPWKYMFPDSAILEQRMVAVTRDGAVDRDAHELCLAHELLYRNNPTLAEIPEDLARSIVQLPTEKARTQAWVSPSNC